jgi:hypothetical protein
MVAKSEPARRRQFFTAIIIIRAVVYLFIYSSRPPTKMHRFIYKARLARGAIPNQSINQPQQLLQSDTQS